MYVALCRCIFYLWKQGLKPCFLVSAPRYYVYGTIRIPRCPDVCARSNSVYLHYSFLDVTSTPLAKMRKCEISLKQTFKTLTHSSTIDKRYIYMYIRVACEANIHIYVSSYTSLRTNLMGYLLADIQ